MIALSLFAVFVVMISMLQLQDWWDKQVENRGLWSCLGVMPKVFLAAAITIMDEGYFKLAVWLNDQVSVCQLLSVFVLHSFLFTRSRKTA
uniref:Putative product n=1 Tax=Xenopsylla cheopis TaxID=163159 RepID=A0A6M2DXE5_XENCH